VNSHHKSSAGRRDSREIGNRNEALFNAKFSPLLASLCLSPRSHVTLARPLLRGLSGPCFSIDRVFKLQASSFKASHESRQAHALALWPGFLPHFALLYSSRLVEPKVVLSVESDIYSECDCSRLLVSQHYSHAFESHLTAYR